MVPASGDGRAFGAAPAIDRRSAIGLQQGCRSAGPSMCCSSAPGASRARSSVAPPICSLLTSSRPERHHRAGAAGADRQPRALQPARRTGGHAAAAMLVLWPPLEPEPLGKKRIGFALARFPPQTRPRPPEPEAQPETQVVVAFDDNRAASALVGPYGQNLALIERRLAVVVDSRGNHITIAGSREGCDAARRVLETLYAPGGVGQRSGAGRRRRRDPRGDRAGLAVRIRRQARRRRVRGDQSAQAPGAGAHRGAGFLHPRAEAPRAGVRHRPGRHRQDLARGGARRATVRAQGSRQDHPDAPGGRSRRAARLSARRSARKGRSLSAPDLRRAVRPDGLRASSSARCRPARSRSRRWPSCAAAR